eukprot:765581-Hanusia_phi.AAC.2
MSARWNYRVHGRGAVRSDLSSFKPPRPCAPSGSEGLRSRGGREDSEKRGEGQGGRGGKAREDRERERYRGREKK